MKVFIDRDSVCAGDDVDDHNEMRRFAAQMKFGATLTYIINSGFLPDMSGASASWLVTADGSPVAVVSTSPTKILYATDPASELHSIFSSIEEPWLRFTYYSNKIQNELFAEKFPGSSPQS